VRGGLRDFICILFTYTPFPLLLRTIKDVLRATENGLIDLLDHAQLSGFLTLYIQRV
jgi:hypothetical protein